MKGTKKDEKSLTSKFFQMIKTNLVIVFVIPAIVGASLFFDISLNLSFNSKGKFQMEAPVSPPAQLNEKPPSPKRKKPKRTCKVPTKGRTRT